MDDHPWSDLPGEFTFRTSRSHADWFVRDMDVVLVEHRIRPGVKIGGWVPVSRDMLNDVPPAIVNRVLVRQLDRHFRPWLYPQVSPFPEIDLFPRWTRLTGWLKRRFRAR